VNHYWVSIQSQVVAVNRRLADQELLGPKWGEAGTGRFIRSDHEEKVCGWDEDPQSGSGCDGGPERVWVCGTCGILYDAVAPHF